LNEETKSQNVPLVASADEPRPVIIVHGGAYDIPRESHKAHLSGCHRAAQAGWDMLEDGGSALDAVEAAVYVLEDDPTFDAGRGSFLNLVGEVEMDAIIMDGRDLNFGAVAAINQVRHPVTAARMVMDHSEHALLVGVGAEAFAREHGLPECSSRYLKVKREEERWHAEALGASHKWDGNRLPSDTVGAVALDAKGNLAVATSTGGTFNKHPGRVGDSPLVGCGGYADNRIGAVSATGEGEALMKVVISKTVCDFIAQGMTAQEAADAAIAILAERTTGEGGVIVIDRNGNVGVAHNTPYIAHAYIAGDGEVMLGIEAEK
jgi:L-asparaginase / beta-aspartyl-peptidase